MTATEQDAPPTTTGRGFGPIQISLMVIAAAAPLAVVSGSASSMAFANGAGTPVNFIVIGLVLALFSVGYLAMFRRTRAHGGFYDLIERGLGFAAASGGAYAAVILYIALPATAGGFIGVSLQGVLEPLGVVGVPWWVYGYAGLALIGVLTFLRVTVSAKVLGLIVALEIVIVLAISAAVILAGGAGGAGVTFESFTWDSFTSGSVALGLTLAMGGAFLGFEGTTLFRREARDPDRTIPRATYLTLAIMAVLYAFGTWLVVVAWGPDEVVPLAAEYGIGLYFVTAGQFLGPWAAVVVALLLTTSIVASITMVLTLASRYIKTLGTAHLLPRALGRGTRRHDHPVVAIAAVVVAMFLINTVWAVTGTEPLLVLALSVAVASSAFLAILTLASISVVVYFRRNPGGDGVWKTLVAPGLSVLLLVALIVLLLLNLEGLTGIHDPVANIAMGVVPYAVIVVGGIVGAVVRRRRGTTHLPPDPATELP